MSYEIGQRVNVYLTGLHHDAGPEDYWAPGKITEAGDTYTVQVDEPLDGKDIFPSVTGDRLQALA